MSDERSATCAGCRYFVRHQRFDHDIRQTVNGKAGDCRRMAPRARLLASGGSAPAAWPMVLPLDFCGEWKAGEAA